MLKNKVKIGIGITIGLIVVVVLVGVIFLPPEEEDQSVLIGEPVFVGDSKDLKTTKVVATLDSPIDKEINVIWCASFLSAWKTLEADLAKEPISLQDSPKVAVELNKAVDPRPYIPKTSLYTAAGWNQEGIIGQIAREVTQKFPNKTPPTFPDITPNSFVAYAYLEANIKFSIPYFQTDRPLVFTDIAGNETEINSFGINPEDEYAYFELRKQPAILFAYSDEEDFTKLLEFAVDLDQNSRRNQIVLAVVEPKLTLMKTLEYVENEIDKDIEQYMGIGPNDVLLVPDIIWHITHRFTELEEQEFTNKKLRGQSIDIAQQDIQFRLTRSGAELKSEAKTYMMPIPTYYVFDRPFLLYMKKRGAKMPYFVMWIGNAELLNKWQQPEQFRQDTSE